MTVLVDSNVILDILTNDPEWFSWSSEQLTLYARQDRLAINPIIYAEIAVGFPQAPALQAALPETLFQRLALPWESAFLAGQSFLSYWRRGGSKTSPLPDFYIGAHATVAAMPLITRDVNRYRTYFPDLRSRPNFAFLMGCDANNSLLGAIAIDPQAAVSIAGQPP